MQNQEKDDQIPAFRRNEGLVGRSKKKKAIIIFASVIGLIFLAWALKSKTSGEIADLSLSPTASTVTAGDNFNVAVNVNTRNNNVVAVKGVITYNPSEFSLEGWDTANSIFSSNNSCVYNNKPCEIIVDDKANGKIIVTLAKPTPGINTPLGLIANLTFKSLKALQPTAPNIKLSYVAYGNYTESDVILDDGLGTDILNSVTHTTIIANLPVPKNLAATPVSATKIGLAWDNSIGFVGISGYKIFRNNVQVGTANANSYQDIGLSPLTVYSYKISAYDASGKESVRTVQVSATTPADTIAPTVPANVAASSNSMSEVDLKWDASTDEVGTTGYNIYRDGTKIGTATGNNYKDTGLAPETTYGYRVEAYDAVGNMSAKSVSVSAKTLLDTQAPTIPVNLSAKAVSVSQVDLSWSASTDNVAVTGYNIYRDGTKIGTSSIASYQDKGLTPATAHSYAVSAFDAKNNQSDKTAQVSVTTNADTSAPTIPSNLVAVAALMTQINLSWSVSADNVAVTGYNIYRDGIKIGTSASTAFQDTNLTKSTKYNYSISAYDAAGNQSSQTNQVLATTLSDTQAPSVPNNLSATATSMTQVDLSWSASTDNVAVTGYNIYRDGTKIGTSSTASYQDKGLTENTGYSYAISAYDADGNESGRSTLVSTKTLSRKYSISDFSILVSDWMKATSSSADINRDQQVNTQDLGIMMSNWQ